MFNHSAIYTIHENHWKSDLADRLVLVREGFSWLALLFAPLWLIVHRAWRVLGLYIVILIAIQEIGSALGAAEASLLVVQLGVQLMLGFYGFDVYRMALARRGYSETGVVCGESAMLAQRRALEQVA